MLQAGHGPAAGCLQGQGESQQACVPVCGRQLRDVVPEGAGPDHLGLVGRLRTLYFPCIHFTFGYETIRRFRAEEEHDFLLTFKKGYLAP